LPSQPLLTSTRFCPSATTPSFASGAQVSVSSGTTPGAGGLHTGLLGEGGSTLSRFASLTMIDPLNGNEPAVEYPCVRVLTSAKPLPVGPELPHSDGGMTTVVA